MSDPVCAVCGCRAWRHTPVLWQELVDAWGLSAYEASYIDAQQGTCCMRCGANLRSAALASAIASIAGTRSLGIAVWRRPAWRVLEVNEAGSLTRKLSRWPRHILARYPQVDLQRLPYPTDTFDLVVHSDTLEHVRDPRAGLRECLRVLRPGGWLCYTVPIVIGRLTRRADDNNPSYHGTSDDPAYRVITEYGADAWVDLAQEGVVDIRILSYAHPAAHALVARKPKESR